MTVCQFDETNQAIKMAAVDTQNCCKKFVKFFVIMNSLPYLISDPRPDKIFIHLILTLIKHNVHCTLKLRISLDFVKILKVCD